MLLSISWFRCLGKSTTRWTASKIASDSAPLILYIYCIAWKKKPCAHKCRHCARFLVHRGFLELCAALCAGLVRKGLCAVVRTAYDGCARVCARDLVRKPCARAFLALPTLRNTKACAYRTAQLSGGVCATRFAAAQLLHN